MDGDNPQYRSFLYDIQCSKFRSFLIVFWLVLFNQDTDRVHKVELFNRSFRSFNRNYSFTSLVLFLCSLFFEEMGLFILSYPQSGLCWLHCLLFTWLFFPHVRLLKLLVLEVLGSVLFGKTVLSMTLCLLSPGGPYYPPVCIWWCWHLLIAVHHRDPVVRSEGQSGDLLLYPFLFIC